MNGTLAFANHKRSEVGGLPTINRLLDFVNNNPPAPPPPFPALPKKKTKVIKLLGASELAS